jgi:hypothetical protein
MAAGLMQVTGRWQAVTSTKGTDFVPESRVRKTKASSGTKG